MSKLDYGRPAAEYRRPGEPRPVSRAERNLYLRIAAYVILIPAAAVAWSLRPTTGHARINTPSAKCRSNLRMVGVALHMYVSDHGGRYPADLDELYPYVSTSLQAAAVTFVCPSDAAAMRTPATRPSEGSYRFAAARLLSTAVTPGTVVVYEAQDNHGQGTLDLLFGDGHAEAVPTARALPLIAAARAIPRLSNKAG